MRALGLPSPTTQKKDIALTLEQNNKIKYIAFAETPLVITEYEFNLLVFLLFLTFYIQMLRARH